MRQVISGAGVDSTSAAQAYLQSTPGEELRLADLYLFGELEDPNAIFITNWGSDLLWKPYGTFKAATIKRGTVTTKIGLEVTSLEITWSPKPAAWGQTISTANVYQKAYLGFYRNLKVRIFRTIMPTPGDASTYGAYELFGGRIANTDVSRGTIKFTINSFLDVLNMPVPPNVIETTNVLAGFTGATPVLADGETALAQFTVVAPTTADNILATCTSPTANKIYSNNKFLGGYIFFNAGSTLAGAFTAIAGNFEVHLGGGVNVNQFFTYAPFPWAPTVGDTFFVSSKFPLDAAAAQAAGVYQGFLYVPAPEAAV